MGRPDPETTLAARVHLVWINIIVKFMLTIWVHNAKVWEFIVWLFYYAILLQFEYPHYFILLDQYFIYLKT